MDNSLSNNTPRGAPLPGPTTSDSLSTFLGFMQRRLSDFVAGDSRAVVATENRERGDSESQALRDYAVEHESAPGERQALSTESSSHRIHGSPSIHRAG